VRIFYDAADLRASVEEIRIEDERLRQSWPDRLYRILLTADRPQQRATWTTRIMQG
jgi:hypothetical protein